MGNIVSPNLNKSNNKTSIGNFFYKNNMLSKVDFEKSTILDSDKLTTFKYDNSKNVSSGNIGNTILKKFEQISIGIVKFVSSFESAINDIGNFIDDIINSNGTVAGSDSSSVLESENESSSSTDTDTTSSEKTTDTTSSDDNTDKDTSNYESDDVSSSDESSDSNNKKENEKSSDDTSKEDSSEEKTETSTENSNTIEGTAMDVPSGDTSFKSYTNYRLVTDTSTPNYALNNGLPIPYGKYKGQTFTVKTDDTGMRYVDKGDGKKYYTVAMGTYYGEVGDTFNIQTDDGNSFDVIICDAKGNDTGTTHEGGTWYHTHGGDSKDLVEFYIDSPDSIRVSGGTTGDYNYDSRFSGNITSITKYN